MNKLIVSAVVMVIAGCTGGSHEIPSGGANPPPFRKTVPAQMSPESYLRKLSLHIRGMTPSRTDYEELALAEKSQSTGAFFHAKIATYLTSDEHIDKMTLRLEELFFLRPSELPANAPALEQPSVGTTTDMTEDYTIHNSLNQLFRDVAARNMSWDTLLTGKRYLAYPLKSSTFGSLSDPMFLSSAAGIPKVLKDPLPVKFEDDDARVAGALTTSRFFNRYGNTALNKNRRRAAAVFRIFLCDNMPAVVVDEAGNQDPILDKVFPGEKGGGRNPNAMSDRHGSDEACMKCHDKLDPMGLTFQASGLVLSPFASAGALVYPRTEGGQVHIQAHGLGDLAETITKQDEYARCQVRHFWNWFVGADIPLDEVTLRELTMKFDEVDRRTNDFIAYLMERPEFGGMSAVSPEQELENQAKGLLQKCSNCHDVTKKTIPRFDQWPIGGDKNSHLKYVGEIKNSLGLDGSGKAPWMPPQSSDWRLSPAQVDLMKRWFASGAGVNAGGKP